MSGVRNNRLTPDASRHEHSRRLSRNAKGSTMDARQQRGLEMAARLKISKNGDGWVVPSSTGKGRYHVHLTPEFECCNCPDFELTNHRCKHLFAVEYVIQRELNFDGTVTETVTKTVT